MNLTKFVGPTALVIGLTVPAFAAAQDAPPPIPKPGPEHALFKMDAGTWDATVELTMAPGAPPATSKGVEVNTIGCGGLCLISDFKGEMMGMAFLGHGTTTWTILPRRARDDRVRSRARRERDAGAEDHLHTEVVHPPCRGFVMK